VACRNGGYGGHSAGEGSTAVPFPPPLGPGKAFAPIWLRVRAGLPGARCGWGPRLGGPTSAFGRRPVDRCWILTDRPSGTRQAMAPGMGHLSLRRGGRTGPPVASIGACAWRAGGRFPGPRAAGCRNAAGCRKRKPR
jgi:hypothetical protein